MVMPTESVLERVVKEVPNMEEKIPIAISMRGPWGLIAQRAVEMLKDQDEIKQFMEDYITRTQQEAKVDRVTAEKYVNDIMGYCTGSVDDRKANIWFNTLPDISHPIMRRQRPFLPGDIDSYYIIGQSDDPIISEYLEKTLPDALVLLPTVSIELVPRKDNTLYFAFRLKIDQKGMFKDNSMVYMYLEGVARGLPYRMQTEIGKSCGLSVETVHSQKSK